MARLESLEDINKEISQLRGEVNTLIQKNTDLERNAQKRLNDVFDRVDELDSWANFISSIDDLPGVKQPKWYKVVVPFDYLERQEKSGQVQISASGPFVCTQMQSYFEVTDTDETHYSNYYNNAVFPTRPDQDPTIAKTANADGRFIPPTAFFGLLDRLRSSTVNSTSYYNPTVMGELFSNYSSGGASVWYEGWNYPELDVRIQTANNNAYWTGLESIPSAALYGVDGPLYLATPSIVQASDSIVAFAKPSTNAIPLQGNFVLVMHGYHIGIQANLDELLGV